MMTRDFGAARRWVVKLGSSLLTSEGRGVDQQALADWCRQIAQLREQGREVVVVTSGAVAAGMARLGLDRRPTDLAELQAVAAVGQLGIARLWEEQLALCGLQAGQVLLTHEDAADRARYLNARNSLQAMLQWKIVPIVNENDTVATEEIRFGDNDTLAAVTADLVSADLLVILTDQAGVLDGDPRVKPDACLIDSIEAADPALDAMAGGGTGALGRGGMQTKVLAARMVARSGISCIIAGGRQPEVLLRIAEAASVGTWLRPPARGRLPARKRWLASQRQLRGRLHLDAGAVQALRGGGRSLLPVGVTAVEGRFERGDVVACVAPDGTEIARGLCNYDAREARQLCGQASNQIVATLGRPGEAEIIHRNNLVLTQARP